MPVQSALKTVRLRSGLSLRAAAGLLGICPSTLYRYEEGHIRRVPAAVRDAMRHVYGTELLILGRESEIRKISRRISAYEEGRQLLAADLLPRQFERLDARGKRTVLNLLRFETRFGSDTYPPEGKL